MCDPRPHPRCHIALIEGPDATRQIHRHSACPDWWLGGCTQRSIQIDHERRGAAVTGWHGWITQQNLDHRRCRTLASVLDHPVSGVRIVACIQLGDARRIRRCPQNVSHLVTIGDRVQVSSRWRIAGGLGSQACRFAGGVFRCAVGVQ